MKISTFVEVFTAALYNETKITGMTEFRFGEIIDRYSLHPEPMWANRILQDDTLQSYVEISRHIGTVDRQRVSIAPPGVRWVEETLGENVAQFLDAHGAYHADDEQLDEPAVHSSSWTGLPETFVLTDERRASIVRALDAADESLPMSTASQHDQSQAHAYIIAARALLEAPDPEPQLAWELIGRANNLAGIASLFVAIIALFN